VLARWPNALVPIQLFGLIGGSVGLIASAFVTKPWHLILTLGICFPMSAYLYLPAAYLLFEWFVERRGIASGIMYGGTGVGGAVIPFLMTALLNRFGYKASMVALGVGFAILGLLAIPFIKRRIPVPKSNKAALHGRKPVNRSFLRRSPFYCFIGSIFFSSLSSFLPSVWIPSTS
jgi:MFS family permease